MYNIADYTAYRDGGSTDNWTGYLAGDYKAVTSQTATHHAACMSEPAASSRRQGPKFSRATMRREYMALG